MIMMCHLLNHKINDFRVKRQTKTYSKYKEFFEGLWPFMDEISHSMETYENLVDSHGTSTLIKLTQGKKED
jgi:hypothetical protein